MDEGTGTIVDIVALQKAVDDYVVEPFDHTFLNKDIPHFAQAVPTAENIAAHIANPLKQPIRELGAEPHKVKRIESRNNSCEIFAADPEPSAAAVQKREPVLVPVWVIVGAGGFRTRRTHPTP